MLTRRILVRLAILVATCCEAGRDAPLVAAGPLAVDVVSLKSGKSHRGAILARRADGSVVMAVSRAWLQKADPKEFARQSRTENESQQAAWTQTRDRIEKLLADPPESRSLNFFLKQELPRLEQQLKAESPTELPFFILEIPGSHVAKLVPAPPDRQRIAQFAWKEGVKGVETRPAADLRKDLIAAEVDVDGPLPDLSDLLPAREQSEAEWSARLAIVEYTLGESLDFQGIGDSLVRTGGEGQELDLAVLLPKLLTSQVDSLFGDLLDPGAKPKAQPSPHPNALKPAIAIAEKHQQLGFRVTRLDLNAERLAVTVHTEFVAHLGDGKWEAVWKHVESADGSKVRADAEKRIANDPQVKTVLESLKGFGADDAVTQAIRVGAATMAAQQAADAKFYEFRDRYVKRLDGPPLFVPK
jgi:hypothetical protein